MASWFAYSGYVGPLYLEAGALVSPASGNEKSKRGSNAKGSIMSAHASQGQKTNAYRALVPGVAQTNAGLSTGQVQGNTLRSIRSKRAFRPESIAEDGLYESADSSLLPLTRVDAANLIRALWQLEVVAKPQAQRIAFKAKGKILFLDLAEIVAVQAEGNYVSLRHRLIPYLLHESLSSMAEKLKPYGFIRIHRSVVVNISAVQEIQPLPTGEYRLRVKGGNEYSVTRTYKDNLRDLAQLWVGSERLCG